MIWDKIGANGLYFALLIKYMGCYLRVLKRLHNGESVIYILTGKFKDVDPIIFSYENFHSQFQ